MSLVVKARVFDVVITLERLGIEAPFCIHRNLSLAELCLLGSDHDDSVGAAGTVKSI